MAGARPFFAMGIPGLLLALLVRASVARAAYEVASTRRRARLRPRGFGEALRFLSRRRSYLFINLGGSASALVGYGFGIWAPTFFIRVHGMSTVEVGLWLGWLGPLGGIAGSFVGGAP